MVIVRSGLSARHTGPSSSDAGTSPTQNHTYSQVGAGLAPGLGGPSTATRMVAAPIARPSRRSSSRVAGASTIRCTRSGSGRPASGSSKRGSRQNATSTTKEMTSAAAPPYWASHSGTGRSERLPIPWASGHISAPRA
jgi:hypothetical protein